MDTTRTVRFPLPIALSLACFGGLFACDAEPKDAELLEIDADLDEPTAEPEVSTPIVEQEFAVERLDLRRDIAPDPDPNVPPKPPVEHSLLAPSTGPVSPKLQDGTQTTDFHPVVQILTSSNAICTATAVSHDTLLTAAHCLKSGDDPHNWVKIYTAHGDNSDTEGEYSSYFLMSDDVYYDVNIDGWGTNYRHRDLGLVKFGADTFSAYYSLGSVTSNADLDGEDVTIVGFGGNTTKHYGVDTVTNVNGFSSGEYRKVFTNNNNNVANTEGGDSGGPWLQPVGNSYEVVAVTASSGIASAITDHVTDHVSPVIDTYLAKYCIETYKHADYDGKGFSVCIRSSINNKFGSNSDLSDTWMIEWHDRYSEWNDELSSLIIPDDMIVTLFKHSDTDGTSATYNSLLPMGTSYGSDYLGNEGMNDKVSSIWLLYTTGSGLSLSYYIENEKDGKCMELDGGDTSEGTPIDEVSCDEGDDKQLFKFVVNGSHYEIQHAASGKCLQRSGSLLNLRTCDSGNNQLYSFEANDSTDAINDFHIKGYGGECLELLSSNDGFHTEPCDDSNSRQGFVIRYR